MNLWRKRRKLASVEVESGSATIWAVGFICLLVALALGITLLAGVLAAKTRAQNGADFAALAAAQTYFYGGETAPCAVAEQVARENQVSLTACSLQVSDVKVEVSVKAPANWLLKAHSRAGPRLSGN